MALFFVVKGINHLRRQEANTPPPPEPPTKQELILSEIRDLLAKRP
jgi:large conductance mechanosensitive channel